MGYLAESVTSGLAMLDGLDVAFPAANADGTSNQAARDTAVLTAIISAGRNHIFEMQLSSKATITDLENFFSDLLGIIAGYKKATGRSFLPIPAA